MQIIDYFTSEKQEHWLDKIKCSDWSAGRFLYELLRDHRLKVLCGVNTRVLLPTDADELIAFCKSVDFIFHLEN